MDAAVSVSSNESTPVDEEGPPLCFKAAGRIKLCFSSYKNWAMMSRLAFSFLSSTNKAILCPLACFFTFFFSPRSFHFIPLQSALPFTPSDPTLGDLPVKDEDEVRQHLAEWVSIHLQKARKWNSSLLTCNYCTRPERICARVRASGASLVFEWTWKTAGVDGLKPECEPTPLPTSAQRLLVLESWLKSGCNWKEHI